MTTLLSFPLKLLCFAIFAAFAAAQTATMSDEPTPTTAASPPTCPARTGVVVGSVLGTFFATLILFGLIYLLYRRHWTPNKSKSLANLTGVEDGDEGGVGRYAYDNPYFEDSEPPADHRTEAGTNTMLQRGEQGEGWKQQPSVATLDKKVTSGVNNGTKTAKKTKNLFNVLTTTKLGRHRALDDSCIHLEPEKLLVPLRGIDFTGLGFNVCGNMRDGIFIKDVLHRGPAMESGKIKAGDRILNLTVSFANMVYEDALTILSYASPYDVQLEVQKMSETSGGSGGGVVVTRCHQKKGSNSSNASSAGDVGARERLYHPLYRSQSIGDLSKIGKEDSPTKRSSSIDGGGVTSVIKVPKKEPFVNMVQCLNEEASSDLDLSKTLSLNVNSAADVSMSSVESLDTLDAKPKTNSRFRVQKVVENDVVKALRSGDVDNQTTSTSSVVPATSTEAVNRVLVDDEDDKNDSNSSLEFETVDLNDEIETLAQNTFPVPLKRTSKRMAPQPPSVDSPPPDDDDLDISVGRPNTLQVSPDIHEVPLWVSRQPVGNVADSLAIQTNFSSDNESICSDDDEFNAENDSKKNVKRTKRQQLKEVDRKASSLGDLTHVDESNKKNFPLERSVSMDFNHAELVHGKLAMQQIEQLGGPKLNENGLALGANGGSSGELVRANPLKFYFGATENLHLGEEVGGTNGHCNFLKSWDQVENLVDAGDAHEGDRDVEEDKMMVDDEAPPPIPKSPLPRLIVASKEDEGDLWEVDLSESSSSLSDEEPRVKAPLPPSKPPPPPIIKRMIPVDISLDRNYDHSSSTSSDGEDEETVNHHRVIDVPSLENVSRSAQPTSYIHHDANTGSSTVTIGAAQPINDKQKLGGGDVDPEMAKIFNNVTVSNTSKDLYTLDIDNWVPNGSSQETPAFRNGRKMLSGDSPRGQQLYETTLELDVESPDSVGVISFESNPPPVFPPANKNKSSGESGGGGVSRTLIISTSPPQLSTTDDIRMAMDSPPSLQPPQ